MKKADFTATVIDNVRVTDRFYRLYLLLDAVGSEVFSDCVPGQFAEFKVSDLAMPPVENIDENMRDDASDSIILRRPFSFSDIRKTDAGVEMDVLYGVVGAGTIRMTTMKKGDKIGVIGPLGNGFKIPADKTTALLIGGGTGTPPIQHLSKYLKRKYPQIKTTVFVGARSKNDLPVILAENNEGQDSISEFAEFSVEHYIASDDGSIGFKGVVTEAVEEYIRKNKPDADETIIFACGPAPMLKAAAKLAGQYDIDSQLSTERMMACGIGLCQSCAVETKSNTNDDTEYKLCCKDGPVFNGKKLKF